MRFYYMGSNSQIRKAVDMANKVCEKDAFYKAVAAVEDYDLDNTTPQTISSALRSHKGLIYVRDYWKPFSKVNAYFTPSRPNTIHLNTSNLKRSIYSIVNTVVHEGVHVVDHALKDLYFGHVGNSSYGKENTGPYRIGTIAQAIASKGIYIQPRLSLWQKIKNFFRRLF